MKRKIEICRCCSEFIGGRFIIGGFCIKADYRTDDECVPEDCPYKLEQMVLGQKDEVKQKSL